MRKTLPCYPTGSCYFLPTDLADEPKNDIGETTDVSIKHPGVFARLQAAAEAARQDLGDKLNKVEGTGIRPAGRID